MSAPAVRDEGFGLIEAIIALAVVSIALTGFYKLLGNTYRAEARNIHYETVIASVRSHLDAVTMSPATQAGTTTGAYPDGTRWRLAISPIAALAKPEAASSGPYWIVLEALDGYGRTLIRLETAKLGQATDR